MKTRTYIDLKGYIRTAWELVEIVGLSWHDIHVMDLGQSVKHQGAEYWRFE